MKQSGVIETLGAKVEKILSDNRMLRGELKRLTEEKDKALLRRRSAEQQVIALEKRLKTLELKNSFLADTQDNRAARLRINKLLREIDNCIALLNR